MEQQAQPEVRQDRYYALDQLEGTVLSMRLMIDVFPIYREWITQFLQSDPARAKSIYDTLSAERARLVEAIHHTLPLLREVGEDSLAQTGEALRDNLRDFRLMTPDYGRLTAVLRAFADAIPTEQKANAAVIGRLMNNVRMGFYPTDLANVGHITRGIAFPAGIVTNLLDPCCGTGAALKKMAVGNNCFAYGVELDKDRAEKAEETLHRVGFGSFFFSRVENEAFHVVYLNPPYLSVLNQTGGRSRDEKRFLIESIPTLMMGGLMVYVVPYYRMSDDICRIFADHFSDITAYRFTDEEFQKHKQIVVLGLRRPRVDGSEEAQRLAASAYKVNELPCVTELTEGRYPLPAVSKQVEIFKGAEFNVAELARQLKQSDSFERMFTKRRVETGARRPPLPLSIGQVGLVGGSGLINGLMECDYPHIIKGRIIKVKRSNSEDIYNSRGDYAATETRETISNKMVFNLLTPNGFMSLA